MAELKDGEKRLKQLQAAEEELQRRRERGKLSQREFRKRQSKATQGMREENERLRAAIGELVGVVACNDRPELRRAIRKAALIAGIDVRELDGGDHDRNDIHTRNDSNSTFEKTPSTSSGIRLLSPPSAAANASSTHVAATIQLLDPALPHDGTTTATSRNEPLSLLEDRTLGPPYVYPAAGHSSGRLSPRLDYGLWFGGDSGFVRLVDPPLDIVPYLGEGMYTLAGRITWACAEYLVGVCRRVAAASSSSSSSSSFSARPAGRMADPEAALRDCAEIKRMIQHSPPMHDVRYIKAMAEARLEFRRRGYVLVPRGGDVDVTTRAGDRDSGALLQRQVERDYAMRKQATNVWVTSDEVAQHVRAQIGDKAFARLEGVLRYHDNSSSRTARPPGDGGGDDDGMLGQTYALLRLLIRNLAESFVCFGDGPRWSADRVGELFAAKDWEA